MQQPYIAVVGGLNMDLCGRSFAPLIPRDSNPGRVTMSPGGVGRNIAQNLTLLGQKVYLLTALADDEWEARIRADCEAHGVDLSRAIRVPGGQTSTYLFLSGPDGDMALAVCDAALADYITPDYLEDQMELLNGAEAVVIDANLTEEAIDFLAANVIVPIFADTVSVTKAQKLRAVLPRIHTLKPNRLEAEILSGVKITDGDSLEQAASALLDAGVKRVFLSLGTGGLYCAWRGTRLRVPCPETAPVNTTGAGDALTAGLVRAFTAGLIGRDGADLALACAAIAMESESTVNPQLSLASAMQRAGL